MNACKKVCNRYFIYIFLLFLPLTYLYPRINSDDYGYAFSWDEEEKYIETVGDFFEPEVAHYLTRNGRIWSNGIAAIFSASGFDLVFKVINALMFLLLIFLVVKLAVKKEPVTPRNLISLFLLTWFFNPVPGETWLWMCGALNYLWAAVFTFAFLWLLRRSVDKKIRFKWQAFVFCIVCGWQHEAFAAPIWGAGIIYYLIKKPQLSNQTVLLWIGYTIGALCMIFAPGTIHRMGGSIFSTTSIGLAVLFRIYTFGMLFVGLKLKATIIAIVMLLFVRIKDKNRFNSLVNDNLLLLLIVGCGVIFMSLICYVEERGLMCIEIFSVILIYRIVNDMPLDIVRQKYGKWEKCFWMCMLAVFVYDYSMALKSVFKIYEADKKIMSEYLASTDGIVCSPLTQKDYDSRFVFYCNEVNFQEGITKYYNYHTGIWKPFHLIPKPFYDAMEGDNRFFDERYRVKESDSFYQYGDEKYYFAKYGSDDGRKRIERIYAFKDDGIIRNLAPNLARMIERYYSRTNLQVTRLEKDGVCYVFVNKIKRMLPELELKKLDLKAIKGIDCFNN